MVCPHCGSPPAHRRPRAHRAARRRGHLPRALDASSRTLDPLEFADLETYPERVREAQAKTGLKEAIVTGTATIDGTPCVLAVMDFGFMGGSMGSVVGEKLWRSRRAGRAARTCRWSRSAAPAARACRRASSASCRWPRRAAPSTSSTRRTSPFVTVLADPCTGGVVASFATLADICIAEPGARLVLLRPARHRRDHPGGAAAGLRQRRAQPRARPPRRGRAAQGPARQGRQLPATAGRR